MTGYLHLRDDDQLLHVIARQLVRDQSQGICDENYPRPCDNCDCFDGSSIRYAQQHAAEVIKVLRSQSVEPIENAAAPELGGEGLKGRDWNLADTPCTSEPDCTLPLRTHRHLVACTPETIAALRTGRRPRTVIWWAGEREWEALQRDEQELADSSAAPVPVQEDRP